MSITIGKRNFTQSFTKMGLNNVTQDNLHITKVMKNENTPFNKSMSFEINAANFLKDAQTLKQQFPEVDDKEIITVLDDCDNNVEIAVEILQRSTPCKLNLAKPASIEDRGFKKINVLCSQNNISKPSSQRLENRKQEPIQEEEMNLDLKLKEAWELSGNVINKLQTLNHMQDAHEFIANIICEVKNEAEKKNQALIKKLEEEKSILIKAFLKQREKAQKYEEKNEEMSILLNGHGQEIMRLRSINYKLSLRLKSLDDINEGENHNFDIC